MPDRNSIFEQPRGRRADAVIPKCYETILAAGAAVYAVAHNIGTRRVLVSVYVNAPPYTEVMPQIDHTDNNTTTITFAGPTGADHVAVVLGLPTR